mmetsp:Transcript_41186/g.46809  ORF Transcript_41186/g.46809 Transcript_41186/m.46809 type:complete len:304 (+) Transcript_41186:35-946(+)
MFLRSCSTLSLLFLSPLIGSSAFQQRNLKPTVPYLPRKDGNGPYSTTSIFGEKKIVLSTPYQDFNRINSNILNRREIISSLLTISASFCFPHESLASDEMTNEIDSSAPFTVILSVQTDAKSDATSKIEIEVRPDWAPLAAKRFRELVEIGFYNDSRFFRVLPGYIAQFGIAADPKLNKEWMLCEKNCKALPDEPRKEKNKRGTLSFASSGENSRQTQVFINLGNNDGLPNFLDGQNFVPFARVVRGMDDTVKNLNSEYGIVETVSAGLAGGVNQGKAAYYGAEYLDAAFPKLSILRDAKVIR